MILKEYISKLFKLNHFGIAQIHGQEREFKVVRDGMTENASELPENLPLVLQISGPGILSKKVKYISDNLQHHFNQVLPGAHLGEFEMQLGTLDGDLIETTVCRKSLIEDLVQKFKNPVVAIQLGNQVLESWQEIEPFETIETSRNEVLAKQKFQVAGWSILLGVFAVVLINLGIFNFYFSNQSKIEAQYHQNKRHIQKFKKLKKQIADTEYFVKVSGWDRASQTSYFAERIAAICPRNIQLTSLDIHPLIAQKSNGKKKFIYDANSVNVIGVCQQSAHLNDWIFELKAEKWIKDLKINNYIQRSEDNVDVFELSLELN